MYKERYGSLPTTLLVGVYRNLNTKCWSSKSYAKWNRGRVVLHSDTVWLHLPRCVVSERGREQTLTTQVRNVHAHILGEYLSEKPINLDSYDRIEITYNPYKYGFFYESLATKPKPIESVYSTLVYAEFTSDFRVYVYSPSEKP